MHKRNEKQTKLLEILNETHLDTNDEIEYKIFSLLVYSQHKIQIETISIKKK